MDAWLRRMLPTLARTVRARAHNHSYRLQEGQPNGLQKPAARNGSSRQQQPAPGEPQRGAGAAADGGGGESDESAGKED